MAIEVETELAKAVLEPAVAAVVPGATFFYETEQWPGWSGSDWERVTGIVGTRSAFLGRLRSEHGTATFMPDPAFKGHFAVITAINYSTASCPMSDLGPLAECLAAAVGTLAR